MPDSSSFSMSTQSGTSTGVTNDTSLNDESSSSSITTSTTIQTSSPDDSDGLAAEVGGSAIAVGEDTLAAGSLSGVMIDDGAVTSVDLSATMVAASEDSDGAADAWTDTSAYASDGTEVLFSSTVNTQSSQQNATGSTATSTSTTNLSAIDIDLDTGGTAGSSPSSAEDDDQPELSPTLTDFEGGAELDGSFASIDFTALAEGENTFVSVDAYALAVEDELALAEGFVVLAVD